MKLYSVLFTLFIAATMFFSCEKTEGTGGTSTIAGKIWVQGYHRASNTDLSLSHWGEEVDVYLIYGNDTIYSDRTKTNYDGSYWFQYLHEGTYTVYAYSDTSLSASLSGRIIKSHTVELGSDGSTVIVPTITVRD